MKQFDQIYQSIISENIEEDSTYIYINVYNTVKKFYKIKHINERGKKRYTKSLKDLSLDIIINAFIEDLNMQNIWNTLPKDRGKGFTIHAKWSDIWVSGYLFYKNNQKKIYVSTVLPPPKPTPYPDDLVMEIDI